MREVRVYDEAHDTVWPSELGPGEVALFYVDAETGRHRNAFGRRIEAHWDRTCLVFPSLEEAVAHAERKVREVPSLACRLYVADDLERPVRVVANVEPRPEHDPRRIRRRAAWGTLLCAVGVVGIVVDWYFDWFYIFGVIFGVKFLTVGLAWLVESLHYHLTLREKRELSYPSSRRS